jgi:hypothetical protein
VPPLSLGWSSLGRAVTVRRVAALVFIAVYPAYDAFAGLVSGFLVQRAEAHDAPVRDVLYDAAAAVLDSPMNAGSMSSATIQARVSKTTRGAMVLHSRRLVSTGIPDQLIRKTARLRRPRPHVPYPPTMLPRHGR